MEEPLVLEVGSHYELRCGIITGKLRLSSNGTNFKFDAIVEEPKYDTPSIYSWLPSGRFVFKFSDHYLDIIKKAE